jgi:chromosome segregation protein
VSELLYPSGLAERTYTVIGQGLVDAVLSLRADERRRLFEEAAGIGLYRSRREEAIRRLDSTRRNLERVQDILLELTPRLSSLERQARRAREHTQAVGELRAHANGMVTIGSLPRPSWQPQENARLRRNYSRCAWAGGRDRLTSGYRQKIQARQEGLNALHHELSGLHSQREATSQDLAVAEERNRLLENQLPAVRTWSIWGQFDRAQLDLQNSSVEVSNYRVEIDEANSQLSAVNLSSTT